MNGNPIFISPQPSDTIENERIQTLREKIKQLDIEMDKNLNENRVTYMQISELLSKFKELQDEKLDLENRFTNEKLRFSELVDKLRDRLRLVALSTLEMQGKIRILNSKVPELEDICDKQHKTIDDIMYKLKTACIKEIQILEKTIDATEADVKHLENEILKTRLKNKELNIEFESLTNESNELNIKFEKDEQALKENITKIEQDNSTLEKKLDMLVDVNKDTYMHRIHSLEKELSSLSSEIKYTTNDKLSLLQEMRTLQKEVKNLKSNEDAKADD